MRTFIAAFVACGTLFAGSAQAVTVTETAVLPLSDVEIGGTLSVAQFDPNLGTLTSVTFSITGAIASILGVTSNSAGTVTGNAFTSVDFNLTSAVLGLTTNPAFSVLASTGAVTLGPGESALFPVTASSTISDTLAPSAAFIGNGTIDLDFLTSTSFGGSGFGGDITISQATDAGLMFEITYEFDDSVVVPLPASAPLLAGAAGLLGLLSLRRARAGRS